MKLDWLSNAVIGCRLSSILRAGASVSSSDLSLPFAVKHPYLSMESGASPFLICYLVRQRNTSDHLRVRLERKSIGHASDVVPHDWTQQSLLILAFGPH